MSLARICDRCGAPAIPNPPVTKSIVIAQTAPATNAAAVTTDFGCTITGSIGGTIDLCPICALAAIDAFRAALAGAS